MVKPKAETRTAARRRESTDFKLSSPMGSKFLDLPYPLLEDISELRDP